MVLISVDLPQPFGPKMHTCSPHTISRVMSWMATRSPRMTVTCARESRGAGMEFILGSMVLTASRSAAGRQRHLTERGYDARDQGWRISEDTMRLASMKPGKRILMFRFETAAGPGQA